MNKSKAYRLLSLLFALCIAVSAVAAPALAATVDEATIDTSKKGSLTLYKYDFTNAAKDGVWSSQSYVSTGQYDSNVNNALGAVNREGDDDSESVLGNQDKSNGYAIKGVEYSYLKVAEPYQFHESANNETEYSYIEVLYKFDKTLSADLLAAIGLADGLNSYDKANALDSTAWFYRSDVISKALSEALFANATTVKNALESYVKNNGGIAMPLTNQDGRSYVGDLPLGLYLLVETKVPEMVTDTTSPFFVALPMTNIDGGGLGTAVTDGGHKWLYDVTLYPKNESGIVTLEKTSREAKADTGVHGGSLTDITDGFSHNTTASTGDKVDFQIISTLPTITSAATYLTEYSFQDVLSKGMSYTNDPVKIEWFTDKACTNKVTEWAAGTKFTATETKNSDGSHTMDFVITDAGLNEINTTNTAANNANGSLYAGYSNYTMRITYTVKLNADASMVYGDDGNDNTVVLTWKRTSSEYKDTLIDDCHVYTYGIVVDKDFSDGKDSQDLYDHVLFKVQNKTDGYYVVAELNEDEGIWYVTGHTDKEATGTPMHPVTWNNEKGQLVIKGLENDEYVLTEIETADSYIPLTEDINVTINAAANTDRSCDIYGDDVLGVVQNDSRYSFDGSMDLHLANIAQKALAHDLWSASAMEDDNSIEMLNDEVNTSSENALAKIRVVNNHGFNLPQTGETTASIMPIVGGIILAIACLGLFFVLIPARKKKAE